MTLVERRARNGGAFSNLSVLWLERKRGDFAEWAPSPEAKEKWMGDQWTAKAPRSFWALGLMALPVAVQAIPQFGSMGVLSGVSGVWLYLAIPLVVAALLVSSYSAPKVRGWIG